MKYQAVIADTMSTINIDVEILMFLCSLALFYVLHKVRQPHTLAQKSRKLKCDHEQQVERDTSESTVGHGTATFKQDPDAAQARFTELEKSLRNAFDDEDYWQVLKCWGSIKRFNQCPPVYLSQIVKAMQCLSKDNRAIIGEIRDYLKWHPHKRSTGLVNEILESLARQLENIQLVEWIVAIFPSFKLTKNSRTYEILLTMYSAVQDYAKAQDLLLEMKERKIELTPCARVAVVNLALHLGNIDMVLKNFSRLTDSWDVRSTWAVSPFALQRHKTHVLKQIVELARQHGKLTALLPMLEDIVLPEDFMNAVRAEVRTSTRKSPQKVWKEVHDEASTSEGSRSDSEMSDQDSSCEHVRPPPGL